jgi:hypothetical protein
MQTEFDGPKGLSIEQERNILKITEQRKIQLEKQLAETNEALKLLNDNPQFVNCFNALAKLGIR